MGKSRQMRAYCALPGEPGCGLAALPVRRMRRTLRAFSDISSASAVKKRGFLPGPRRGLCAAIFVRGKSDRLTRLYECIRSAQSVL
jgi:hypothetical protein